MISILNRTAFTRLPKVQRPFPWEREMLSTLFDMIGMKRAFS